jgi:hypothetical protein
MECRSWRHIIGLWLVIVSLVLYPADLLAQSNDPEDDLWADNGTEPSAPRPSSGATGEVHEADEEKQLAPTHPLYLPYIGGGSSNSDQVNAAAVDAVWQTVIFEGFEGIWPENSPCWVGSSGNPGDGKVYDYNGDQVPSTSPGTLWQWDDTSTRARTGFWSGHPTDGPNYVNHTHTYMICGPINLSHPAITNARLRFDYYLDSETNWDFFSWSYSCNGISNWTGGSSVSGQINAWRSITTPLTSCRQRSNVFVRFGFHSDYAVVDQGVWVDNIRVEKFQ